MALDIPSPIDSTNFKLDSDGILSSNTSICRAYRSSYQSVNSGSNIKLLFNATVIDKQNEFDTTNSKFVAKVSGIYLVHLHVYFRLFVSGNLQIIRIHKNGGPICVAQRKVYASSGSSDDTLCLTELVSLNADGYLEAYVYHDYGSARDVLGDDDQGHFLIIKLA